MKYKYVDPVKEGWTRVKVGTVLWRGSKCAIKKQWHTKPVMWTKGDLVKVHRYNTFLGILVMCLYALIVWPFHGIKSVFKELVDELWQKKNGSFVSHGPYKTNVA